MPTNMLLVPGRSKQQGTTLNKGKLKADYQQVTSTVEMSQEDMQHLGFSEGDRLRLSNAIGEAIVTCTAGTGLPAGMLFIPYGPQSSQLMESDTAGSGMPLSKHLAVDVEKISSIQPVT